jgi:hypothetical protein
MLRVFAIQVRSYKRVLRMCGTKKAGTIGSFHSLIAARKDLSLNLPRCQRVHNVVL